MTPDILDMSGSHVGTALRVAMNAYHKAARTGFTLMDVSNAPLAKRRKKKNFSSESQKGSDDSTETNDSKTDTQTLSGKDDIVAVGSSDSEQKLSVSSGIKGDIPALAVCLSPSMSSQRIVETIATSREPPPLRPISSDYDSVLSGCSSNSTESNFFFKEFLDSGSAQMYSHGHSRYMKGSSSSRSVTNDSDSTSHREYDHTGNQRQAVIQHPLPYSREGFAPTHGTDNKVVVQRAHGMSQYTCSTTKQSRASDSDVMNNNILDIALSGLREGNLSRKRPYQP